MQTCKGYYLVIDASCSRQTTDRRLDVHERCHPQFLSVKEKCNHIEMEVEHIECDFLPCKFCSLDTSFGR